MLGEIDHKALAIAIIMQAIKDTFTCSEDKYKIPATRWLTGKNDRYGLNFWCEICEISSDTLIHRVQVILNNPEMISDIQILLRNPNILISSIDN